MQETEKRRILRTQAAAHYVGSTESTMEKWRMKGVGPRWIQLSARTVGYTIEDLDAFIEERRAATAA